MQRTFRYLGVKYPKRTNRGELCTTHAQVGSVEMRSDSPFCRKLEICYDCQGVATIEAD